MTPSRYERYVLRLPAPLQPVAVALQLLWEEWILLIVFNMLWLLSWLTIVLGPPTTFAIYHAAHRAVEGRKLVFADLWVGIKRYFVQSWLWMLANLLVDPILVFAFLFYAEGPQIWARIAQLIVMAMLLFWATLQFYALPCLVIQEEKSLRLAWYNGWLITRQTPGYTLVLLLSSASLVALILLTQGFAFVLGGVSFLALMSCQALRALPASVRTHLTDRPDLH